MGTYFVKLWVREYDNDYDYSLLQRKASKAVLRSKNPRFVIFSRITSASIVIVSDYHVVSLLGRVIVFHCRGLGVVV